MRNIFHASIPELWIHGHENSNITEKDEEVEISSSCNSYLLLHALFEQVNCFESQNRENNSTCIDSSECIGDCDDDDIFYTVLIWRVVGAKANDGPKGQTKRIKHLVGSIKPDSWLQQHFHLEGKTLKAFVVEVWNTFGVNMWDSPAVAPFKVIPRKKKMVRTMYGNMAVK